jgi:transposase
MTPCRSTYWISPNERVQLRISPGRWLCDCSACAREWSSRSRRRIALACSDHIRDRNSPQKHVWRSRIVVLSADGAGTTAITRAVGKGKTVVWRWQERFMHEGVAGLIRDKTRPSRIPPLPAATVDRVVALTNQAPPHEATHWTALAMAKSVGISPSSVRRIWKRHGLQPHRVRLV